MVKAMLIRDRLKLNLVIPYMSFLACCIIVLDFLGRINIPQTRWLLVLDTFFILVFAFDYVLGLIAAQDKRQYFKKNLVELVSILPIYQFRALRALRLIRLVRLVSLMVRARGMAVDFFSVHKLAYVFSIMLGVIMAGALVMYYAERGHSINSVQDAIWWAVVTITTVGYGDISPVTGLGKFVAILLMIAGVGVLGAFTGTVASIILVKRRNSPSSDIDTLGDLSPEEMKQVQEFIEFLKFKRIKQDDE